MNRLLLVMLCLVAVQTQAIKRTRQEEYKLNLRLKKSDLLHFSIIANVNSETQKRFAHASQATLKAAYKKLKETRVDVQSWLDEMEKIESFSQEDWKIFESYMQTKYRINKAIRTILKEIPSLKKNRLTKYVQTSSRMR